MKLSRDFLRFFAIPLVLLCGILLTAGFAVFYTTTTRSADGRVVINAWPKEFTQAFSEQIAFSNGKPVVTEHGAALLAENDLWLQIVDADGNVVVRVSAPFDAPAHYSPQAFLHTYQSGTEQSSVFVGEVANGGETYAYLIGFPLSISKVTMYVDAARCDSGKALIVATVALTVLLLVALTVFCNGVVTKHFARIRGALGAIAARTYTPAKNPRFLAEIYAGLAALNDDIAAADAQRATDEAAREAWLGNITHDLKTPLAPIRGYAELLAASDGEIAPEQAARYGGVILKNARYAEQLVSDLRLTYQLKSGMLPIHKSRQNITRFARELVIELLNMPDFAGRDVSFASDCEELELSFDPLLMRRALTNLIVNALTHSGSEAAVAVEIAASKKDVTLTVADNGNGMTPEELAHLFDRYYRGTSTEAQPEGSGLGMAIAKQIVEAHGGTICAKSGIGAGTTITLTLPADGI